MLIKSNKEYFSGKVFHRMFREKLTSSLSLTMAMCAHDGILFVTNQASNNPPVELSLTSSTCLPSPVYPQILSSQA